MLRTSTLLIGSMAIVVPLSRAAGQASEMQSSDEFRFELLHQTLVSITQRYGTNVMSTADVGSVNEFLAALRSSMREGHDFGVAPSAAYGKEQPDLL